MDNRKIYFSFGEYSNSLVDLINRQNRQSSLVIAITGSWGCGKTTLLDLTLDKLKNDIYIKTVFNAWRYTREDAVWRGFFISIIEALRKHISDESIITNTGWNEEFLEILEGLLDDTERSLYTAFAKEIPGELSIDTGNLAKTSVKLALKFLPFGQIGPEWVEKILQGSKKDANTLSGADIENIMGIFKRSIIKQQTEKLTSMEQFRHSMERLLSAVLCGDVTGYENGEKFKPLAKPFKLVVGIDDLDRCLPEQALEIFEAIKLFLDLPRANFIVAMDQDIIQHALDLRYKQGMLDRPQITAENYTEKMIDLSFAIPSQLEPNFLKYIEKELPDGEILVSLYDTLKLALPINLRTWDRYATKANFNKKILEEIYKKNNWDTSTIFNDKSFINLYFKLQCLAYRWPKVFRNIGDANIYAELERCILEAKAENYIDNKDLSSNIIKSCSNSNRVPNEVWNTIIDINLIRFLSKHPLMKQMSKNKEIGTIFSLDH